MCFSLQQQAGRDARAWHDRRRSDGDSSGEMTRYFLFQCWFQRLAAAWLAVAVAGGCSVDSVPGEDPATTPLPVGRIQGTGDRSPLEGQRVTIEAVVTADFQGEDHGTSGNLGGFFVTGASDNNALSSDGLFVFEDETVITDVAPGDRVRVSGKVVEFFGETQLKADSVVIVGQGSVEPVTIDVAARSSRNSDGFLIPDLERYEGMLVRYEQPLTVIESWGLDRYGELLLGIGGRIIDFTNTSRPDTAGYAAYLDDRARRSIILDDGLRDTNHRPVRYLDPAAPVRVGDTIEGLTGVLRYSRGAGASGAEGWRLEPTAEPVLRRSNPRQAAPETGGSVTVAGFNVLNLFTTHDTGDDRCGPTGDGRCRGADSPAEFDRQLDKIVTALAAIDADIFALVELENNAGASLDAIVDALEQRGLLYNYVDTGTIGQDAIKVGLIYKPASTQTVGEFAILDGTADARFNDGKNRPVLAQTFAVRQTGARFTVAVNHLKSKGSPCDDLGDPDTGDGQGDCAQIRTAAAQSMVDWLARDPTASGDPDILILGDLNARYRETAAGVIEAAGYTNLVRERHGDASYSYVYRGQSAALDHAFASESLAKQVTGAAAWHINADESRLLDYNLEGMRDPDWFRADEPFRSSDHDPIIVGLEPTP